MKVILLKNIEGLGKADEVKEVAEGYAKNFLFPKHVAVMASAKEVADRDARHTKRAKDAEKDLREQQALADRVEGREVDLKEKANKENVLYAAVTPQKIADKLVKMGFAIAPEQVLMKPEKNVGSFPVKVKFRHGLEAGITVTILAEVKIKN